ncbi:PREDICTED: androgen-induced gene 1 protein-like isoform X1 [Branchiostoma belcheri]|uniref:Androgen-induced gene 1 protein-like isoform X1 n=1 Tax=Branchiostoma belcheri TaxID=7741 RepID=A0A6P4Z842_BRABE|nr:PREDICTED: androgen-induced gene 1 protein-like isoform X1 [Branchiostoma belcheri]
MMASAKVVSHLAVFLLLFTANYNDFSRGYSSNLSFKSDGEGRKGASYAGRWKYLSILVSVAQMVFFGSCVLSDVFEAILGRKPGVLKALQRVQDYLFAVLLFPMAMTVQCLFWAIYAIDRELVYPSKLDAIIPTWLNHVWHTTTVPVLLLEMYVVRRRYPARTAALPGTVFFGAAYLIWIRIVAHYGGFWVYPFLEVMGPIGTSVFNMAAVGMLCVFYMVGEYVNTKLWGRDAFEISSTTSRKKSNKSA